LRELLPYLWSYLAVGLLLAVIAASRREVTECWSISASTLILLFWPGLLVVAPEFLIKQEAPESYYLSDKEKAWRELVETPAQDLSMLSEQERLRVERVAANGEAGTTFFASPADYNEILGAYWEENVPPEAHYPLHIARWRLSDNYNPEPEVLFSLADPDWYVGFSSEFIKSISKIDKNKRARVLEAIAKVAEAPLTIHGDTVKPLTGNHSGLWRYRIGDDRLVYKASTTSKQIVLLSFGARGDIYERDF
jgi:mRNA-degrading endonuclease RelE of RelBE toxin-antitoxin system